MKPRLFKRAGVWFCALPGEAGAVGPTMRDAWEWWVMLKAASREAGGYRALLADSTRRIIAETNALATRGKR